MVIQAHSFWEFLSNCKVYLVSCATYNTQIHKEACFLIKNKDQAREFCFRQEALLRFWYTFQGKNISRERRILEIFFCFDKANIFQFAVVQYAACFLSFQLQSNRYFFSRVWNQLQGIHNAMWYSVKKGLNHNTLDLRALPFSGSFPLCPLLSLLHQAAAIISHFPQQLLGFGCICPHFCTPRLIPAAVWMNKTALVCSVISSCGVWILQIPYFLSAFLLRRVADEQDELSSCLHCNNRLTVM